MLYTIAGALIGGLGTYVVCKVVSGSSFDNRGGGYINFPSGGEMLVLLGTVVGAGIGFGFGTARFMTGHYFG